MKKTLYLVILLTVLLCISGCYPLRSMYEQEDADRITQKGTELIQDLHFRVGPPYTMRHLPWYMDSKNPTEEDLFYFSKISTSTHWSEKEKK